MNFICAILASLHAVEGNFIKSPKVVRACQVCSRRFYFLFFNETLGGYAVNDR